MIPSAWALDQIEQAGKFPVARISRWVLQDLQARNLIVVKGKYTYPKYKEKKVMSELSVTMQKALQHLAKGPSFEGFLHHKTQAGLLNRGLISVLKNGTVKLTKKGEKELNGRG